MPDRVFEHVHVEGLIYADQLASAMKWMRQLLPIAFEFYALAGRDKELHQFLKEGYFEFVFRRCPEEVGDDE